jgi:8-oxo-dGTP diphosphatase
MINNQSFAVLATDVAVLTVTDNDLKVLLTTAKSKNFRGIPTLPGGLVGATEKSDIAAERILKEVLGSVDFYKEQLFTFDEPKRDPAGRVVAVAYLMLIPWNVAKNIVKDGASWFSVKSLPKLAYDHNEVVKSAVKRIVGKFTYTNIVFSLMPLEFKLSDLQKVYEIVLGINLDKRNFVKKIKSLKLLTKTGHKVEGEAHRPASLYRFTDREYKVVEVF